MYRRMEVIDSIVYHGESKALVVTFVLIGKVPILTKPVQGGIRRKPHTLNWASVSLEARGAFSSLIPVSFERPSCMHRGNP